MTSIAIAIAIADVVVRQDSNGRRAVPFVSPPHFRTGSVPPAPPNPVERAALVALNHARNDRSQPKSRKVV